MLCLSKKDEPPDGGENKDQHLTSNCTRRRSKFERWIFKISAYTYLVCLSVKFLLFHREITISKAREFHMAIFPNREQSRCYPIFKAWFTINWLLMSFDNNKESLAASIHSGCRAMDAIRVARTTIKTNSDFQQLAALWGEFKPREPSAFDSRDRSFFMSQLGVLFTRQFKTLLHEVMTLTPYDYEVLVSLCRNGIASLCRRIRAIGTFESFIVDYFNEHQPTCCRQILTLKPTLLAMARRYVNNMVAFCLQVGLKETAHDWVIAGRHIIALQESETTAETFTTIHKHLDQFFQYFDKASAAVYVEYQSSNRRLAREHEDDLPDDTPAQPPVADTPPRANDAWTAFYGRDVLWFHISDDGSTISDTTVVDNCGHYEYEYTGITENATIVRNGLAFFFNDFDKNCEARQDNDGDWVVTRENNFIKMSKNEMKKFKALLKTMPGMNHFIPDVLSPKDTGLRTDGKPNNRSGKYRIDPRPGACSGNASSDAILTP